MKTVTLAEQLTCLQCQHSWRPRGAQVRICPKCKSAKWDVAKKPEYVDRDTGYVAAAAAVNAFAPVSGPGQTVNVPK